MLKMSFFVAVSKKCVFGEDGAILAIFFVFGPWCPLLGMYTENTWPFSGPKWFNNAEKWIFLVLGAVPGERPAGQTGSHAEYGPSKSYVGFHVPLEARDTGGLRRD